MLSEKSQTEKDKYCVDLIYMWNLKSNKLIDKEIRFLVIRGGE